MRVFIDTSSLFKKYVTEKGTSELIKILEDVTDVCVAPITYIEITNTLSRFCVEAKFGNREFKKIKDEIDIDFGYFSRIALSDELERIASNLCRKYPMKSYDLVQLSSAIVSKSKIFITSDKQLYSIAKKEIKDSRLI